jgi:hypothetical protein
VKRKSQAGEDSPDLKSRRGLPELASDSPRLTAVLPHDLVEALDAFAKAHRWRTSTAIRAILREKLLGETLPF